MASLIPLAAFAVGWAIQNDPLLHFDGGFAALGLLTIFSACWLRIQLPRTNVHLTISDALIILSMLLYGGSITILLALVEVAAGSLNLRLRGTEVRLKTIAINISAAPIGVFAAYHAAVRLFGPLDQVVARNDYTSLIWLLLTVSLTLFAVNSATVAIFAAIKTKKSVWYHWKANVVDAAFMYVLGGLMAGVFLKAVTELNLYIVAAIVGFFGVIFLTFRHFVSDARRSSEIAHREQRERYEEAEKHVAELEHYVAELEKTADALHASHEKFRHAAFHDALTGLPNRNFFIDRLKELLATSAETGEFKFAILLLDLYRFKTINESLGHSLGDRLIKNVGSRLAEMVRESDMAARFSGDKFGIILTDLLERDEAAAFAERLSTRISEPYTLDERQVFTDVRVGIAFGNSKYAEAEDLLRDADIAMYYAKDSNAKHVIFDQKMHVRAVTRLQLETDLRFAIERHEFELHYQPIVALETARLVGFEALVRWNHPQRGLVPPNEFIPISESTGLIVPMTVQILESACKQVKEWQLRYPAEVPLSIAVNLSGKHFADPQLVAQIKNVLAISGLDPLSLKLELTESAIMENAERAIQMLSQIKEIGVQLSIDDFGTGYSSLSYLHRFPIDLLKVDRSFVSAMEENSENGEIVRTVIALAKALRLNVVAEGIESIHQFHQLRILKCEYGQGYLFSKPQKVADIENLLADEGHWQHFLPQAPRPVPVAANISPLRLAN
ncbi:MAG TPA: bifunctional diguanylate cyclase/phosphodiesterase [Pyrinomonadaceae bacterium]|nr:bifunctional diguanylate cyclase/phosphodiesterase [Pyrinomonadaceae bacterium]